MDVLIGRGCMEGMDFIGTSRSVLRLIAIYSVGLLLASPALGLDPAMAITQYLQTNLTNNDGLPQNSVHAVAQTKDGFLWLGTEEGLARFDGVQFTVYTRRNAPGLASDYIQALAASQDGSLWIGTDSGLTHFVPANGVKPAGTAQRWKEQFASFTTKDGLSADSITALWESRDGTLWVGTRQGLNCIRNDHVEALKSDARLAQLAIHAIAADADGTVWVGTEKGLYHAAEGGSVQRTIEDGLLEDPIVALTVSRDGTVWAGTLAHGLVELRNGRPMGTPHFPGKEIDSIFADRDGALWIAFDRGGIGRLLHGKLELYGVAQGLPSNRCTRALFEDREGNLWVGLLDSGVVELRSSKFAVFGKPEGLSGSYVGNVLESRDGSMWIGSDSNGVNHLLPDGRVEVWNHRQGLPEQAAFSLLETGDGSLWIGYKEGSLARILHGKVSVYKDSQAPSTSLNALFEDRDGTFWVGYFGKGVARLNAGHFDHLSLSGNVSAITQSSDGALWFAYDGSGVERWFHGSSTRYTTANGLPTDHVMSLYADRNNDVWIGTASGGLSRFRNGHLVSWTADQGLPESTIGSILEDDDGSLWFGGDSGIFSISKQELNHSASTTSRSIHATLYGTSDGLRSRETVYGSMPASWKDHTGRLWFATILGAAVIDPAHLRSNNLAPPVWIQSAAFNSHRIPLEDGFTLGRGSGNLAVSFTAPSFVAPRQMRFRYRLAGFDPDWNLAGNRRDAWYTNLPPGKYTFMVQAANSDGVWNLSGSSFSFVLKPPLTRTPLAYLCFGVAALLLLWLVIGLRTRELVGRQQELKRLVAERTAQLEHEKTQLMSARKELQFRALHDALTGLLNRGAIMDVLEHEVERARREKSAVTIVLADLDHFKLINDTRGHLCGDHVLAEAAQRLRGYLRSYDSVGRYGGEEFLLILPGYDAHKDPSRAVRLVSEFRAHSFEFQEQSFPVTCSFGVVVLRPSSESPTAEDLLRLADEALYRAKRAGRDRIEFSTDMAEAPTSSLRR